MQAMNGRVTRGEIRDRLIHLVNDVARIPSERITDAATLDGELRMESVAFVEIQVAVEDEYHIEIDPVRVVELNAFGAIVDYVYECVVNGL